MVEIWWKKHIDLSNSWRKERSEAGSNTDRFYLMILLFFCFHRDIVIPKSRAVQQNRRMRTETSVDTEDDDAFFDSEDDDEDQDESK